MTTRIFRWDDPGAPALSGTVGSLCAVMKACFVGSGGVAYGSGPNEKLAAGWTVEWEDPVNHKLVLRNNQGAGGNDAWIRILDDGSGAGGAREAFLQCYESMTDIDTGTGPATALNSGNGVVIRKSSALTGDARAWVIAADALRLYGSIYDLSSTVPTPDVSPASKSGNLTLFGAGDPGALIPSDPSVFVAGREQVNSATYAISAMSMLPQNGANANTPSNGSFSLSRDAALAATPTPAVVMTITNASGNGNGHGNGSNLEIVADPPPGHAGILVTPSIVAAGGTIRAAMPGLYVPACVADVACHLGDIVAPVATASPRALLTLSGCASTAGIAQGGGRLFADTGDWNA